MKIIAVNETLKNFHYSKSNGVKEVEKALWKVSIRKLLIEKPEFLITVSHNSIWGYYRLIKAYPDEVLTDMVKFKLSECSDNERARIDEFVKGKMKSGNFAVKMKW